jgi:hypothetical protein
MPFSTDHSGDSLSGRAYRTSGNSDWSATLVSSSPLTWERNFFACGAVCEKIPIVISGLRRISWIAPAKVMIVLL